MYSTRVNKNSKDLMKGQTHAASKYFLEQDTQD